MIKKLTLFAALLGSFFLASTPSKAQIGVYGQLSATHAPGTWYKGFTLGGYGNMLNAGPIHLGVDLRGSYQTTTNYHYRNFLIGPRLEVKPPLLPLRPYVQAEVGFGGSTFTGPATSNHYNNKLQYGVLGGIDFTVLPHIDLRVPEVGYLRMTGVSSNGTVPNTNLLAVGVGLVVRL